MNYESKIKSITVSIRLILPKAGVDEITWPQGKGAVRKENDL